MTRLPAAVAALSLIVAGSASAQASKMGPATADRTAPTHAAAKPTPSLAAMGANTTGHSAAAIDCSKQADAKGLHGKARDKFRSSCKAAAKKG